MDRRQFLKAAATLPAIAAGAQAPPRRPNIVFFILDDMQRFMFNCLPEGRGRNLTPAIDRLREEGVLMLGQHVVSPVCTPSRYNCLTGRYASRALAPPEGGAGQTVVTWNSHIRADDPTLPKRLRDAGYTTGFVGKNHVVEAPGYTRVPYNADPAEPAVAKTLAANEPVLREALRKAGFDYAERIYHNNPDGNGPRELAVHNLDWITEGALEFIDRAGERPFFLYFASTVPHGPLAPERSWNADRRITPFGRLDTPPTVLPPPESMSERLKQAGMPVGKGKENIVWLDDAVAAVMARLRQRGVDDRTIVFFFTDHGQGAKGTLYRDGVEDPCIIRKPGGFACGGESTAPVSNIDFAPTILDLAGVPYDPEAFDGKSFVPVLDGKVPSVHESLYFELGFTRAVLKGKWKYLALRYPRHVRDMPLEARRARLKAVNEDLRRRGRPIITEDPTAPFSHVSAVPGGGDAEHASTGKRPGYYDADQLYDLASDPGELENVAGDPALSDVLADMKRELARHLAKLPGTFAEIKPEA